MILSDFLCEAFNQQILKELSNAEKYMQVASLFEDLQLSNLANYFKKQSDDEKQHANKFMNHVNDRIGGKVNLNEIIYSPTSVPTDVSLIGDFYIQAEQDTTASIENLYELALSEKSYIDLGFLTDMLQEQVEEEDVASKLAMNLKMTKDIVLFDQSFEG